MTNANKLKAIIQESPGLTERELAAALYGPGAEQQRVNPVCRILVNTGMVERRGLGGGNDPFRYFPVTVSPGISPSKPIEVAYTRSEASAAKDDAASLDATKDWFWEGNVVSAIISYLEADDWTIESAADTRSKERGPDIHATKSGRMLLIEAKGYPSTNYRDPRRNGERKPTNPVVQAGHWYSHALLKGMRLQGKHPDAIVALGLPDFPRYRTLLDETRSALERLEFALFIVHIDGTVETWGLTQNRPTHPGFATC